MATHHLIERARRQGEETCPTHSPHPCNCLPLERLSPFERCTIQLAWLQNWLKKRLSCVAQDDLIEEERLTTPFGDIRWLKGSIIAFTQDV